MAKEIARIVAQGLKLSRMVGGGERTTLSVAFWPARLSQLFLSGLPSVFKVSIRNDASCRWLENSIPMLVSTSYSVAQSPCSMAYSAVFPILEFLGPLGKLD